MTCFCVTDLGIGDLADGSAAGTGRFSQPSTPFLAFLAPEGVELGGQKKKTAKNGHDWQVLCPKMRFFRPFLAPAAGHGTIIFLGIAIIPPKVVSLGRVPVLPIELWARPIETPYLKQTSRL